MIKRWVVGFLFDADMRRVVLLRKNRPSWQKGLLNGVGGHIKQNEQPIAAMIREFQEEAGETFREWKPLAVYEGLDGDGEPCECYFFYGVTTNLQFGFVGTVTVEEIVKTFVNDLPTDLVKNLYWLIPMCLDPGLSKPVWFGGVFPK